MILYPPAKINLGLHVLFKRSDGYHEIETCMVAIPWFDILEITFADSFSFVQSGNVIPSSLSENLCYKAYEALKSKYPIPSLRIHLRKQLPMGAGLGGGSADAAYVLKGINEMCNLNLSNKELCAIAATLGSDCPFFIENTPKIIRGRGEILEPSSVSLQGSYLVLIHPGIHVGTKEAYAGVTPAAPKTSLEEVLADRSRWKDELVNDFEKSVFQAHPEIAQIKSSLYQAGAYYASMSGSGSSVFGLFDEKPNLPNWAASYFVFESQL